MRKCGLCMDGKPCNQERCPEDTVLAADYNILLNENEKMVEALQKIANPKKYHHLEPNDYTQVACFMFVADECLKELGKER